MKPLLIDRSNLENESFTTKRHCFPHFLKVWHHHPELELVVVLKSRGTRFIGDSIAPFREGEVVLIGQDLPHMWLNNQEYFEKNTNLQAEAIAIHFKENFAGLDFLQMPEIKAIARLLKKATLGIHFLGDTTGIVKKIKTIYQLEGFDKTIAFIQLLNQLAHHKNIQLLSSKGFVNSFGETGRKNLHGVYEYIFENFKQNISLNDIAKIAHMNPSAFSRFFKRMNQKTFTTYLSEVRIGYACKLLMENKYNVAQICYESGFNNISNFNRQFRKIKNCNPSFYAKQHI